MSTQQVRDEVVTFLLADHETTALALSWTWYLLGHHPIADADLFEEIRGALKARPPTVTDIGALHHAERVVTEALRLYPPA